MLDDFREWLSDNLRYILLGLAVVLILVIGFCVVRLIIGSGSKKSSSNTTSDISGTEAATDTILQTEDGDTASDDTQQVKASQGTSSLTKDDTAILSLVRKYYEAAAAKDVDTLSQICDPWNDEVRDSILQNKVIERYDNISTYSKRGPVDNSYVVYTYYLGKIADIETEVPSLTMLYLTTDDGGDLVVSDRKASQEVADYIASVSSDADVQRLIDDVNKQCEEAKASDPALKEFMASLDSSDTSADTPVEDTPDVSVSNELVCAVQMLNIRQQPNTSSAVMGVLTQGTVVTKIEDAEDGWCLISYDTGAGTIEGYVKLEYMSAADSGTA